MELNEWTKAAMEEGVLQKYIFFKIAVLQNIKLIKVFAKYQWKSLILVKLQAYGLRLYQERDTLKSHILIRLALI